MKGDTAGSPHGGVATERFTRQARPGGAGGAAARVPQMATFVCVFEDKKFSNFFPLSLSLPVFELRIGFHSLRMRLEQEIDARRARARCAGNTSRRSLTLRDPDLVVNEDPFGFGRVRQRPASLLRERARELLDRLPDGSIAVKGGYVVAARLSGKAAVGLRRVHPRRIADDDDRPALRGAQGVRRPRSEGRGGKTKEE